GVRSPASVSTSAGDRWKDRHWSPWPCSWLQAKTSPGAPVMKPPGTSWCAACSVRTPKLPLRTYARTKALCTSGRAASPGPAEQRTSCTWRSSSTSSGVAWRKALMGDRRCLTAGGPGDLANLAISLGRPSSAGRAGHPANSGLCAHGPEGGGPGDHLAQHGVGRLLVPGPGWLEHRVVLEVVGQREHHLGANV